MRLEKYLLIVIVLFGSCLAQAEEFELGNKIYPKIAACISYDQASGFLYKYSVFNSPESKQDIWRFRVIIGEEKLAANIQSPNGWYKPGIKPLGRGILSSWQKIAWIGWGAPDDADIKPGTFVSGFQFNSLSSALPNIVDYYTEGYAPVPTFSEGEAPDFVSGYHDLTPYGPGVVGKTIGPTALPADFKPLDFLNSIINMKHEAYKLGWIKNEGILKSLDAKLDNAKKDIEKGNTRSAKNTLKAFINEVEAQGCESYENCPSGKHLTSEAYGLLKYNAQYLVDHL